MAMTRANMSKQTSTGGFPDLTGDNKVTQADILKGRGVPGFKAGKMVRSKGAAKGGIKIRGAGAATKGFMARGPMG